MAIKAQFNRKSLDNYAERWKQRLMDALKEAFQSACMDVVEEARLTDTYIDQTGNLRSSIGYVLYYNGVEIANNFSPTPATKGVEYMQYVSKKKKDGTTEVVGQIKQTPGGDGVEGSEIGLEYARKVAEGASKKGFVAVIVAGMDYATYVEAKGYDVLSGSTLRFAENMKKYYEAINKYFGTNFK